MIGKLRGAMKSGGTLLQGGGQLNQIIPVIYQKEQSEQS